jgi:hypothetical protein
MIRLNTSFTDAFNKVFDLNLNDMDQIFLKVHVQQRGQPDRKQLGDFSNVIFCLMGSALSEFSVSKCLRQVTPADRLSLRSSLSGRG